MIKSAVISECGRYRYSLHRTWDVAKLCAAFVMLNPSTADAEKDDPTIRKCIGFAERNGFGSISVHNLFAYRATKPKELIDRRGFVDIVGPENDAYLAAIPAAYPIILAWGSFPYSQPSLFSRTRQVSTILGDRDLYCVKRSADRPWHPLYVKYGNFELFRRGTI